jgi:hypothetical protein
MPTPEPPARLEASGKQLWDSVSEKFVLTPAETAVLTEAARTADELARLEQAVRGLEEFVVKGYAGQPRPHPLLNEARQHRVLLHRLVESLNLPDDDQEVGLRSSGRHAQRASRARWGRLTG